MLPLREAVLSAFLRIANEEINSAALVGYVNVYENRVMLPGQMGNLTCLTPRKPQLIELRNNQITPASPSYGILPAYHLLI